MIFLKYQILTYRGEDKDVSVIAWYIILFITFMERLIIIERKKQDNKKQHSLILKLKEKLSMN